MNPQQVWGSRLGRVREAPRVKCTARRTHTDVRRSAQKNPDLKNTFMQHFLHLALLQCHSQRDPERMTFSVTSLVSIRLLVFCIYYAFFKGVFKTQTGTADLPCIFC